MQRDRRAEGLGNAETCGMVWDMNGPAEPERLTDLSSLLGNGLSFMSLGSSTTRLPPPPRFMFGPVSADIARHFYAAATLREPGVFVGTNLVLAGTCLLSRDGVPLRAAALSIHPYHIAEDLRCYGPAVHPVRHIRGRCVMIAGPGVHVFGHWLAEYLPRFGMLAAAGEDIDRLSYLLPVDAPQFAIDLLTLFGIAPENIQRYDPSRESVQAEELLMPTVLHNGVRMADALKPAAEFLRRRLESLHGRLEGDTPRRILVARRISGFGRILTNQAEIERMARKAGFHFVQPELLSLLEQVRLFAGARALIGEYGSALHGSLFSAPGCRVVALRGSTVQPGFIQSGIGAALGQPTGYVFGDITQSFPDNVLRYDYRIATEDFRICLARAFIGLPQR